MVILRNSRFYAHFRCERSTMLTEFLKKHVGLSPLRIEMLYEFQALYLNGERINKNQPLQTGDTLRVHYQPKRFRVPDQLAVLYEDENFIAIDKPFGLPTHPTVDNYRENAWNLLQDQQGQKLYVTHRLDTGTEGVLLLAKTGPAQSKFNQYLRDRTVQKIYRAMTEKPVPLGRHEHHMQTEGPVPKPTFAASVENSSPAILFVRDAWPLDDVFACEIELETGRTHQIRAQMSFLGSPIVGDTTYGAKKKYADERLALECFRISFLHHSKTIVIERRKPLVASRVAPVPQILL